MYYTVVLHLSKDVSLTVINNSSENIIKEKNIVMCFAHLRRNDQLSTCDNSVN